MRETFAPDYVEQRACSVAELDGLYGAESAGFFVPPREIRVTGDVRGPLPSAEACLRLAENGVRLLVFEEALPLYRDTEHGGTSVVRFLRDTMAVGLRVIWHTEGTAADVPSSLVHLWPPFLGRDTPNGLPFFGLFYWRQGPGYAQVRDERPGFVRSAYVIDDESHFDAFCALQQPSRRDALPQHAAAIAEFEQEQLVFSTGEWLISLPSRVVKWPSPFHAL